MNRWRVSLLVAVCLTVLASQVLSAPAPAERSGLEQVPATAPVIVHLRGVKGTRDRLVAMMQNALPDVLKKFQPQMDEFLENGYQGRKLRGLVKDGPIFLVVTELPKVGAPADPPPLAILVAVTNYQEFRDNLMTEEERKNIKVNASGVESVKIDNEMTYFVDRKGYAVVTPNEEVANSFTKKPGGNPGKLAISKEQAAKLLASDLGVYVNMDMVNKSYDEQIKEMKKQIENAIAPFAAIADESQKKILEGVQKAIGPVFQSLEDSQAVLLTLEMRPGGLALHVQSEVRGETKTATLLQDSRPAAFDELERMPNGQTYYGAFKTSAALLKGLGNMISSFAPTGESKEMAAVMEELAKAGPSIRLDSFSFPLSGVQVYYYDDPVKAVAASLKMYKAMGADDGKSSGLKEKPVIKTDAEKYGDFKLHSVQVTWDLEKMAEGAAARGGEQAKKQVAESIKGILGEKMTTWFGTDGKTMVQVTAQDWTSARKMLDQYTKGTGTIGEVKEYRAVRKEMPARASYLGLIDVVHMTGIALESFRPLLANAPVPPGWPAMPPKATMTFVGLAVTLQPKSGSLDTFISAAAVREFYKAVVKPFVRE
jgi:hypothetical protein